MWRKSLAADSLLQVILKRAAKAASQTRRTRVRKETFTIKPRKGVCVILISPEANADFFFGKITIHRISPLFGFRIKSSRDYGFNAEKMGYILID